MPAEIPQHLLDQISAGRCVAFVGAGFSAPAANDAGGSTRVLAVRTADEALGVLRGDGADLIVVDWPVGEEILTAMRAEDLRAPAIVFARVALADRPRALSLGATEATSDWPDLFREIARVLGG